MIFIFWGLAIFLAYWMFVFGYKCGQEQGHIESQERQIAMSEIIEDHSLYDCALELDQIINQKTILGLDSNLDAFKCLSRKWKEGSKVEAGYGRKT